jgi:hypothetical protein
LNAGHYYYKNPLTFHVPCKLELGFIFEFYFAPNIAYLKEWPEQAFPFPRGLLSFFKAQCLCSERGPFLMIAIWQGFCLSAC